MIGVGKNLARRPTANVWSSGADLDFMFAEDASVVPRTGRAQLQCTRAGDTATVFNRYGQLEVVPANTPRLNHDPSVLRYENRFVWSDRIDKAEWAKSGATVVPDAGLGPDGQRYACKLVETNTNAEHRIIAESAAYVAGEASSFQFKFRPDGRSAIGLNLSDGVFGGSSHACFASDGQVYGGNGAATMDALPDGWFLCKWTVTCATSGNASLVVHLLSGYTTSFANFTYQGDGVSGALVTDLQSNSGAVVLPYRRTGATPQPKEYACHGLLDEGEATNVLRNNKMVGAAVGSESGGGFLPQNWAADTTAVQIWEVVSIGQEDGIHYVDIRVHTNGAVNDRSYFAIFFDASSGIPGVAAASGQSWAPSGFARVIGGSLGSGSATYFVRGFNASGVTTETPGGADNIGAIIRSAPKLSLAKLDVPAVTFSNATTAKISSFIQIGSLPTNAPFDVTFRIGMPGLEQGKRATSVIPTGGAGATRSADNNVIGDARRWFTSEAGTVLVEFETDAVATSGVDLGLFSIDDAITAKRLSSRISCDGTATRGALRPFFHNGVAFTYAIDGGVYASGTSSHAVAFRKQNDFVSVFDGAVLGSDLNGDVSGIELTQCRLGFVPGSGHLNGHIRRFASIRNDRRANAELQQRAA